jgi:hypothetical protein
MLAVTCHGRQVNSEYNRYLERLRKENGIIKQPGVDHFIFKDPEVCLGFQVVGFRFRVSGFEFLGSE